MQPKTSSLPKGASPTHAFQYFLWRSHLHNNVLNGFYPEIIATDGTHIRRMIALNRQIVYQEFNDPQLARPIIQRVEAGTNHGVPLLGYSMMNAQDSMAILQTGTIQEPGWLAYPVPEHILNNQPSTLPSDSTSLRLLAGGEFTWENREMQLYAVLEQRGALANTSTHPTNLLDHFTHWNLHATCIKNNEITPIRLIRRNTPAAKPVRTTPHRTETRFTIDARMFREFSQNPSFQIWFEIQLDRTLFCLPEQWNSVWIAVQPSTNP